MVELNNQFATDAAKRNIKFAEPPVKIPISQHENLSLMQPDRFIKILTSKGCLEKKTKPQEVSKYFKKRDK